MGSGIAGRRRLPRQPAGARDFTDDAGTAAGERGSQVQPDHPADLISPQPLSYEERRDRWLRANGSLWRAEPEGAERQRI